MIHKVIDRFFIKQPRLRSFITKMSYGTRDRAIQILGTSLIVNSLSENGYLRAAKKAQGSSLLADEIPVLLSLAAILRPGDTFVDIGANVGLFCCSLSRINRIPDQPPVRFYAYEPHPGTFKRLEQNVSDKKVIARNLALSDKEDQLEFAEGAVSHVFTLANANSPYSIQNRRILVRAARLADEEIEGDSIILKIDVEQQEWNVLQGARELFEAKRIKAVYLDGYSQREAIHAFLRGYNFKFLNGRTLERLDEGGFSLLALGPSTTLVQR